MLLPPRPPPLWNAGPPRDAVARLVREVAAHDRDHWSAAFLQSAIRLL